MPPKPNALTPAVLGSGQSTVSAGIVNPSRPSAGGVACRDGGIRPFWRASTTLTRLGIAAAFSRWPMLVFTEPSSREPVGKACRRERISIGSPTGVPVPCASMYVTSAGSTPASR